MLVLNTECINQPACSVPGQLAWATADLDAHPSTCTLAILPQPRYSSGDVHGNNASIQPFWDLLNEKGVEVAVSSDDHVYERFAPQNAAGLTTRSAACEGSSRAPAAPAITVSTSSARTAKSVTTTPSGFLSSRSTAEATNGNSYRSPAQRSQIQAPPPATKRPQAKARARARALFARRGAGRRSNRHPPNLEGRQPSSGHGRGSRPTGR